MFKGVFTTREASLTVRSFVFAQDSRNICPHTGNLGEQAATYEGCVNPHVFIHIHVAEHKLTAVKLTFLIAQSF